MHCRWASPERRFQHCGWQQIPFPLLRADACKSIQPNCLSETTGRLLRAPEALCKGGLQLRVQAGIFRCAAGAERQEAEGGNSAGVPGCCSGYDVRLLLRSAQPIAWVAERHKH
jgi:hypothetical protein